MVVDGIMGTKSSHPSMHGPLSCDFAPPLSRGVAYTLLKLGWTCDLLWPMEYGGSDVVQTPEPRSQEALQLLPLHMWSIVPWPLCHQEAQIKGHMEEEASSLALPAGCNPQLISHEWANVRPSGRTTQSILRIVGGKNSYCFELTQF